MSVQKADCDPKGKFNFLSPPIFIVFSSISLCSLDGQFTAGWEGENTDCTLYLDE